MSLIRKYLEEKACKSKMTEDKDKEVENEKETDEVETSDYKVDKHGKKYKAHKIVFNKGEDDGKGIGEELKGGQVKLDKNKNGKLDAHDFKLLRKEEAELEEEVELEESMADSWKKVQSMDKGSITGGKDEVRKRLAYLSAVHAHHKKYGNDTKKVKGEIESINRSRIAEDLEEGYVVRYNNPKSEKHGSEKHFQDQAAAQKHADRGNSVDKIGGKYTVHKTNEKGHDIKEDVDLQEAMSPQQKSDFDRMMAGAMSRAAYNAKWKKPLKSDSKVIYGKNVKEEVEQIDEGLQQTLRKYVPGYAKKQIDKKMDAGKFGRDDVAKDANYWRYKKVQDKLKKEEVESLREYPEDLAKMKKADSYKVGDKVYTKVGGKWHKGHVTTPLNKAGNHGVKFQHNGKTHSYVSSPDQLRLHVEEVDLDEAVESGNKGYGYHGQHDSETADKKYSAMHAKVKKVAGEAGHLRDAKKPNVMVKHYLDSRHGRHLAGNEHDHEYIKKDFGKFKKSYKESDFTKESVGFDEEGNLMAEKLTYAQFMEQLLEYTPGPGGVTRVQGRSYGAQYHDPEGDDDADDKPKKKAEPAVKRGRGRPAGSKSGANQKVTSGKSYGGIATHSLNLPK